MVSLKQWDTDWFDRFKRIYATNISMLSLYPSDALSWMRVVDVPYGMKQAERPMRKPDQRVHISKNEEYPQPKYAASEVIKLDMANVSDQLNINEEYYAGDTANALGHVADLNENFKPGIMDLSFNGADHDPYVYGIVEDTASGSTTIEQPGHVDTASAVTTAGKWDDYESMATDLATMETTLESKGFFGPKAILSPPVLKPFLQKYVVDYTAVPYTQVMGYPIYFNPYVHSAATANAANVYMVDMEKFELHMTPLKARAFWSDEQECFVWRWKTRVVPIALPMNDGTDYIKGIIGFVIDLIT